MKKILSILIIMILIIAAAFFMVFKIYKYYELSKYNYIQKTVVDSANEYVEYNLLSQNNLYILETKKIVINDITYASFIIKDSNNKIIYSCPDKYRVLDLKNIAWDADGFSVIVESSDIGTIVYKYKDGIWVNN